MGKQSTMAATMATLAAAAHGAGGAPLEGGQPDGVPALDATGWTLVTRNGNHKMGQSPTKAGETPPKTGAMHTKDGATHTEATATGGMHESTWASRAGNAELAHRAAKAMQAADRAMARDIARAIKHSLDDRVACKNAWPTPAEVAKEGELRRAITRSKHESTLLAAKARTMRDTPAYWHEFYKRTLASCEQWACDREKGLLMEELSNTWRFPLGGICRNY